MKSLLLLVLTTALATSTAAFVPAVSLSHAPKSPFALKVGVAPPPTTQEEAGVSGGNSNMPELGDDGIYHILNKEQHQ